MIPEGQPAPGFTLKDASGKPWSLEQLRASGPVVLFFYPRDDSFGCTREACAFRDSFSDFVDAGAEVIGVSSDSVDSHGRFASKHNLPFQLAADPGGTVRAAYGVPSTLGVLPGRVTYVIDREGVVRHVFSSQVQFGTHVEQALDVVRRLSTPV